MGQAMTGGQQKLGESPGLVAESHVLQEGSANTEAQVTIYSCESWALTAAEVEFSPSASLCWCEGLLKGGGDLLLLAA